MTTPYKDLEFSLKENLTLIRIKYFKMKKATVFAHSKYDFLRRYSLIEYSGNYVILSDKALMYLRFKRKDRFRFWLPVIISIIALLAGYDIYTIPLLEKALQEATLILKTITESLGVFF